MSAIEPAITIREAVGVFTERDAFQAAVDDLLMAGFDRADISLLAAEAAVFETPRTGRRDIAGLEDDPQTPRGNYVSPESVGDAEGALIGGLLYVGAVVAAVPIVAAGGELAAAVIASAIGGGTGGLIGGVLAKFVGDSRARRLQDQLEQGGLLLWVRTWTPEQERRALDILTRHGARDAHVHALPGLSHGEGAELGGGNA